MELIPPEAYQRMPDTNKLDVLYSAVLDINKCSCRALDQIAVLEKKVDRRVKVDTTVAAGAGFIGGFIAFFTTKIWK